MDLFKLVGSIFIKNDEANDEIDKTKNKAQDLAKELGDSFNKTGKTVTNVGKAIAPVSAVMAGALTASVKGASDFTKGMSKMSTLFDTTKTSVSNLSKEFITLSNKTGLSATDLAEAGYQALSAGVDVQNAVGFVETAGRLAKAGFTSTATAVDVLTTAINAYGLSQDEADSISNKLVRTQNLGKTTVDELSSSMGRVIPTASAMNVNIDNLTSGYVALTKQGIATAEATTYINSMLNELGDSGTTVGKILQEKTGKGFQQLMSEGYSLADVLKVLQDDAKASGTNFNELWGSAEAGKASLSLLNGGVDEFNATVEIMASDADDVGQALDKLDTPTVKLQKSLNQAMNSGIELGTAFMTSLTPTIEKFSAGMQSATEWFNSLSDGTKTTIATVMLFITALSPVLMIGGKLISGIGTFVSWIPKVQAGITMVSGGFKALWGVLSANPITLVIGLIAGIVTAFVYLWNTSENFRNFWINLWNSVKSTVSGSWNGIKSTVSGAIDNVKSTISNGLNSASSFVTNSLNGIKNKFTSIFNGAKNTVSGAINAIKGMFNFNWSLPKLKLPHISITGSFSLLPPSVPKFGISWYKKAVDNPYMFTKPTLFDFDPITGTARGAGEADDEIMYGKTNLMNDIREAVSSENGNMIETLNDVLERIFNILFEYIPELVNRQLVLDTGSVVGGLAPSMDTEFGKIIKHKERGN